MRKRATRLPTAAWLAVPVSSVKISHIISLPVRIGKHFHYILLLCAFASRLSRTNTHKQATYTAAPWLMGKFDKGSIEFAILLIIFFLPAFGIRMYCRNHSEQWRASSSLKTEVQTHLLFITILCPSQRWKSGNAFYWHSHKQTLVAQPSRRSIEKKERESDAPRSVCTAFHWHGRLILSTLNWCSSATCALMNYYYMFCFFFFFFLASLLLFSIWTILSVWVLFFWCVRHIAEKNTDSEKRGEKRMTTTSDDKKGKARWLMNICKTADAIVRL